MKSFDFVFFKEQINSGIRQWMCGFCLRSCKSMYSGNHTKFITNRNIFEYIVSIRKLFLFEFIGKRFIGENGNGVSRSNKQQIESSTILSEPVSKFFRNSKYNVSMRAVKTKRSSLGCKLFGIFNTTGITKSRMTGMRDDIPVVTIGTFKLIKAKIICVAKKRTFYIV